MSGLQIFLSVVMSFFFPGLGQLYQGLFYADRVRTAFFIVASLPLCVATVIGIILLPLVWLISFGECCWWALQKTGMPQFQVPASNVAQACLLAAVLLTGSTAYAARDTAPLDSPRDVITGRWEFVRVSNTFEFVPDPAGPFQRPALAMPVAMPTLPCDGASCPLPNAAPKAYVDDCCKCTTLRNCRSSKCSRDGATCQDCPCHEKGDPEPKAKAGWCGNRCGAASARRSTWRRCGSCRGCR